MKKIVVKNIELIIKYGDLGKTLHSRTVITNMVSNVRDDIKKLLGYEYNVIFTISDVYNENRRRLIIGKQFTYVEEDSDKYINSRLKNRNATTILVEVRGASPITNSTNARNKSYVYDLINLITDDYDDLISLIKGDKDA